MTPLESELGWAGGIIDGEGSIRIQKGTTFNRRGRPREGFTVTIAVTNTSRPMLERLAEIAGGGVIYSINHHKRNTKWKRAWTWTAGSIKAEPILRRLAPYIFVKRPQCELALRASPLLSGRFGPKPASYRVRARKMYEEMATLNRRGLSGGVVEDAPVDNGQLVIELGEQE